ncbi:OVARIAN TUMOR DOMAIN-containing deubiquitinating enzyme 12-like [Andrographis paniculata]|uniref:OVARIAN TUMOR DOMAIN-containing deubiquitinating enzyme 12-like n=1 Tax=Andrographis paniculata TaxID=175694 RepID=UPI0021E95D44|nr:OVARIAN TUMOR DOMAIN-containing deubiquitinating enzyme 12-like [Andrographis paniculata]XP_051152992.1 OVARIAN TUMOR DOMAIN-containing deubiquitinating enzyme 12-like [Andrographis paniculata]XP_051152993.1 OVARIAN TUMOR DOMAIN-containing deubiquitinating enzyme 12-like [Andrographis paniculata]XP_051152994.1 OVARIAN TUMOR DOMAIN-containing deubiquitinating enzyme 12-like [Andrographis paniculata]XP_051152995.1 OVARIAN TUMOR DOMAIN-containing deubiquitinating enzyme 12-like [Andrographis pa
MLTYEQDPDVVRWGLQLFDGDPYANSGYCSSMVQHNTDCYPAQYLKGYQYDPNYSYMGNHDVSINCLQEGLSQLSVTEPIKPSFQEGAEYLQTSFCSQDWFPQSLGSFDYVREADNQHEEETDVGISASCSSTGDESYTGEEWSYFLELRDEHALDGEVGKRLNQMVPVPHIPKINGEIPSIDEATLDHQRLLDRLQVYELIEFKVQGDGNCQFRALSDQFYRTPEHHKFVRQQVVNQLRSFPEMYEGYVPMVYEHYLTKMSKSGEWGDHVTLQAAADSYGVKIFVITSFKDTCYIEIVPSVQKSERVISLSFWAEVHYNSIYPQGECPTFRTKKKKRWQSTQHEHVDLPDNFC